MIFLFINAQVDVWGFVNPFQYEVWICSLMIIPIFLLVMGFADFLVFRRVEWDTLTSFVVRNAVHEVCPKTPNERIYHKVFVCIWLWAFLILIPSYAGKID